jgi:hypothetical protein
VPFDGIPVGAANPALFEGAYVSWMVDALLDSEEEDGSAGL